MVQIKILNVTKMIHAKYNSISMDGSEATILIKFHHCSKYQNLDPIDDY
jgi:hypothetical protein